MQSTTDFPEHQLKYRPPLSYIDIGHVIYNGRYSDIYNYARDEYMRDLGYPYSTMNKEESKHLMVVECNIKFRAPIFYDEETVIVTGIEKIGSKSIIFNQEIYKDNMQILCNEARFVMVCIGPSLKTEVIPEELKKAIKNGPASK